MATRKRLALPAKRLPRRVSAQLTLALAEFFISAKMADKNSAPQFSDEEVNNLISYYQSETDLWLMKSSKCRNLTCLNHKWQIQQECV